MSLQDIVNNNSQQLLGNQSQTPAPVVRGSDGTLQQTTPEELSNLAKQAGMQAPPTGAVGATMIGANPDQAKMAGTAAQTQNAIQLSLTPNTILQNADRLRQTQSTSAQQQAEQQKAQALQGLSGTQARAQEFINTAMSKLASQSTPVQQGVVADPTASGISGASTVVDPAKLKQDLLTYQANPNDMTTLASINQALGRAANSQITPDELNSLYQSSVEAIAKGGQAQVATNLTVGDLTKMPSFGYDVNSLSNLLGVPPNKLASMSMADLQDQVWKVQNEEFKNAQKLQQKANSTELGSAEKAQAQQLGQQASASGLTATEDDMAKLENSIKNADQVSFNGQSYKVEDLLGNGTISGIITNYLQAPDGSPTRLQLEQTEPDLVKFIQSNLNVLNDAAKQRGQGATDLAGIQAQNTGLATIGKTSLDPSVMQAIIPGWDPNKISSSSIDSTKIPVLNYLKGLPPAQAEIAATTLNSLTDSQKQELSSLSPDELAALRLDLGTGSQALGTIQSNTAKRQEIDSIDPQNTDALVKELTNGKFATAAEAQDYLDKQQVSSALGFSTSGTAAGLDKNKDGKLDSASDLYSMLKQQEPGQASLRDAVSGKVQQFQGITPDAAYQSKSPLEDRLISVLGPLVKDGSPLTASKIAHSQLTEDDLYNIQNSGIDKKWGDAGKAVQDGIATYASKRASDIISQNPTPPSQQWDTGDKENFKLPSGQTVSVPSSAREHSLKSYIDSVDAEINSLKTAENTYGPKVDSGTLEAKIKQLQGTENKAQDTLKGYIKDRDDQIASATAADTGKTATAQAASDSAAQQATQKKQTDAKDAMLQFLAPATGNLSRADRDNIMHGIESTGRSLSNISHDDLQALRGIKWDSDKTAPENVANVLGGVWNTAATHTRGVLSNVAGGVEQGAKDLGSTISSGYKKLIGR